MLGDASDRGARVVQEMLFFLTGALQTSAVAFFWIDWADGHPVADDSPATAFLAPNLLAHYKESAAEIDPLNLSLLVSRNQKVGSLAKRRSDSPDRTSVERYEGFLRFHGYEDEIDLVMWDGDLPVAAIALFKKGRAGFESSVQWPAVQRFMQHHLSFHPRIVLSRERRHLQRRCGLTARELEVALLMKSGASNAAIAEELGIGLATARTHVVNILGKLGVRRRAQVGAMLSHS
ncbi:MAG: LuxR C-terminal-related transcriptional regulator [Burkholderiales bacterium]|jgi:DNA-binding CsgD family transcriptional regulator|nr:LuxR C-terminal-related transcriptional regulator [Burkholderiales bacterium]